MDGRREWPQERGEEFKPLAFMHTAYISELLDGNLLWSTAAGGVTHDRSTGHVSLASVFLGHTLQPYSDGNRVPHVVTQSP